MCVCFPLELELSVQFFEVMMCVFLMWFQGDLCHSTVIVWGGSVRLTTLQHSSQYLSNEDIVNYGLNNHTCFCIKLWYLCDGRNWLFSGAWEFF